MANFVQAPPTSVILALQYWDGDKVEAMRLARLLADIEPKRRSDVTLAFCSRFDVPPSALAWETILHCGKKFRCIELQSRREGEGHPHGCNQLWAGVMDELAESWLAGRLSSHSVFTLEADGVPLRPDWLDILLKEHEQSLLSGKLITGPAMNDVFPHINGSLFAHLSLWHDRPSLRSTPSHQAWDLFHAATIWATARPTSWMKNVYGPGEYSDATLRAMSKETAWLSSSKDESALAWAERHLTVKARARAAAGVVDGDEPTTGPRVSVRG